MSYLKEGTKLRQIIWDSGNNYFMVGGKGFARTWVRSGGGLDKPAKMMYNGKMVAKGVPLPPSMRVFGYTPRRHKRFGAKEVPILPICGFTSRPIRWRE